MSRNWHVDLIKLRTEMLKHPTLNALQSETLDSYLKIAFTLGYEHALREIADLTLRDIGEHLK